MQLTGGTLRALTIPSLHRRYISLRLLSFAHSTKHFSSVSINPTPKPSYSNSPKSSSPSTRPKQKPSPNSGVSSHRHSSERPPSNLTKPQTNEMKPQNRPKPWRLKSVQTPSGDTMNVHRGHADEKREQRASVKQKRKEYRESPAGLLQRGLDQCSKYGDTVRALELYDNAIAEGIPLVLRNYNCLLYLCSLPSIESAGTSNGEGDTGSDVTLKDAETKFNDPEISKMAIERGFEIYQRMCADPDVEPNEATLTSMARLATIKGDPNLAFDLVKQMEKKGIPPKLRSYWPALHGFCESLDVEMAHEVETRMDTHGIVPEDADLAALLRANATEGRVDQVYQLLHKMRTIIRQVSEPTAEIIQSWFTSDAAAAVGASEWDIDKIRQGLMQGSIWRVEKFDV